MPLPYLLTTAGFVEIDDLHQIRIVEVGYMRIVERDVSVFTDTNEREIDWRRRE
jgi:hypothetical protein